MFKSLQLKVQMKLIGFIKISSCWHCCTFDPFNPLRMTHHHNPMLVHPFRLLPRQSRLHPLHQMAPLVWRQYALDSTHVRIEGLDNPRDWKDQPLAYHPTPTPNKAERKDRNSEAATKYIKDELRARLVSSPLILFINCLPLVSILNWLDNQTECRVSWQSQPSHNQRLNQDDTKKMKRGTRKVHDGQMRDDVLLIVSQTTCH